MSVEPRPNERPGTRREPMNPTARAVVTGSAVGFVVVAAFTGLTALALGAGAAGAAAVAAFTGVWGGPGFGGMMGYVIHDARTAKPPAQRATVPDQAP